MNMQLDQLMTMYDALGKEKSVAYTALSLTHKQRNDVYADFVRKGTKPEVAEVLWENKGFMDYLASVLSSARVPDGTYSKAVAMVYNSHRTALPVIGHEHLEELHRQRLECLNTAFRELKKHPHQAGCKIRDIKDTRELVEDELNDLLAKKEKESM